jgi:hypothetical protein
MVHLRTAPNRPGAVDGGGRIGTLGMGRGTSLFGGGSAVHGGRGDGVWATSARISVIWREGMVGMHKRLTKRQSTL